MQTSAAKVAKMDTDPVSDANGPDSAYIGLNGDSPKASIVFSLRHTAGSLANALKPFEVLLLASRKTLYGDLRVCLFPCIN
jgi:hypothetical protein